MSEIKTDKLSPRTGAGTVTLGTSGDSYTIPAGVTLTNAGTLTNTGTLTNSGTASGFGLFTSYAIIADQKSQNTAGGTFTKDAWRTRDLNTEIADPDGIVSISSNQFTLAAGTYFISWRCPAYSIGNHKSRLYNVTDAAEVGIGISVTDGGYSSGTLALGSARTTIAGSKAFSIEHNSKETEATNGFGIAGNFGVEQYTTVEIFKEA